MKKYIPLFLAAILLFCSGPRKGTDWPTFRGSYSRTGYSQDEGPSDRPEVVWKIDLQSRVKSSPIVVDEIMFLGHYAGIISADPYTGKILWKYAIEKKVFCTPTYYNGDIVFSAWDRHLYRINGLSGEVVWDMKFKSAIDASPVIIDDEIFAGDFNGMFLAVDFNLAKVNRMFHTNNWIVGSAAFDGERFYFGSRDSIFYALNKSSYEPDWEFEAGGDIGSSPAIDDDYVYFGANNQKLFCLDKKSGEKKWEFDTNGAMFSSPAIHDGKLFCGSTDSTVYCLDIKTGEELWQFKTQNIIYSSAAIARNRVYIGCDDAYLYSIDTETGELVWKQFLGSAITASPTIYGNMLFVASDNGIVIAFK